MNTSNDRRAPQRLLNGAHVQVQACALATDAGGGQHGDAFSHWRQGHLDARVIWRRQLRLQDGTSVLLAAWQIPHSPRWEWEAIDPLQDRHLSGGSCESSLAAMRAADAWPALCRVEIAVLA
ncbi:hypothetical protein [Xanthomonas sp. 4461]|uniref:Uncharacterized protein n=1 Tax=Xanthomonas sp. 10-10 TaxID=3115848 RepID=A0AAU7PFW7_9XANT|nr:hypothetical protein [Xanthomonas sp. 4461]MCS3807740.1 hypothetical protein [Xanthomonas sp. 4461]